MADKTFWSLFSSASEEQQLIRDFRPHPHPRPRPEICSSMFFFFGGGGFRRNNSGSACSVLSSRLERCTNVGGGNLNQSCAALTALGSPAQTREFKYSANRNKPFFHPSSSICCVCVCVSRGSEVTAVGEGPMSCGCSLASRLLCLSHYRVEAQHSLKAFT